MTITIPGGLEGLGTSGPDHLADLGAGVAQELP